MRDFEYLLDTNILSDAIRNPSGGVAQRIDDVEQFAICTSIIVACELRYGSEKKASTALSSRIESLLENIDVLPLDKNTDREYAAIRNLLDKKGTPIGPNDLLIASHSLSLGLVLVTANMREFTRVPGLKIQTGLIGSYKTKLYRAQEIR